MIGMPRSSYTMLTFDSSSKVRADATYVDNDGAVHWARNNGDANNERSFGAFNEIASSSWCSTAWGIGPMDRGVQFADLDGDGFDDILCVAPDGLTTGMYASVGENSWSDSDICSLVDNLLE